MALSSETDINPTLSLFELKNKVAVVTGGARGLGFEMMKALMEAGATVACIDLLDDTHSPDLHALLETAGDKLSTWHCNVVDPEQVAGTFTRIIAKHGGLDILVTAAGINFVCPAVDCAPATLTNVFNVNVNGTFYCLQQAARYMIEHNVHGSLITIASMSAHITNHPQNHAIYNATKAAVLQLTRSLACEWAEHHIRVNAISPGYFDTAMTQKCRAEMDQGGVDLYEVWKQKTPMQRLGQPQELKGVVVYLGSAASSFVTGSEILVDGGYTAW